MRTLLILGVLVICVLLVTPSNGDRTESQDGGGEKGTSDLRELVGQNEDGKANGIDASAHLRSRRQEPSSRNTPRKKKNCPGCFSSLSVEDAFRLPKRSRRQEKKQEPSSPNTPRKKKNCPGCFSSLVVGDETRLSKRSRRQEKKDCPGGDSFDITADDEMKSMDSEDLTVPAEPSESPIMETTTKRPCCRWRITPHCKKCPGLNGPFSRLPPDDITADDEKSMDSGDLTVPAEPSEIPIMETTTKLPCCRVPKKEPCQRCTGLNGPFGKLPSDDITADDQKKSMDSRDLTVPAEPRERNVKQLPCCRWPKMGPCKRCPGGGTDIWNPDERSHHRR